MTSCDKKLRNFPILVIYEVIRDDMLENFRTKKIIQNFIYFYKLN